MNPFSIFVSKSLVKSYQVSPELIMNLKNSLNPMLKFSPFCTLFVLSVPQGDSGQAPQMPHTCLMGSPSQIPWKPNRNGWCQVGENTESISQTHHLVSSFFLLHMETSAHILGWASFLYWQQKFPYPQSRKYFPYSWVFSKEVAIK